MAGSSSQFANAAAVAEAKVGDLPFNYVIDGTPCPGNRDGTSATRAFGDRVELERR